MPKELAAGLLRSPPFPGIDPAVASVDAGEAVSIDLSIDRVCSIAAIMARARVGGNFWGVQLAGRARLIVPDKPGSLPADSLADALVLATGRAADAALRRGAMVATQRDVDPWPLVEAAKIVVARPDNDLALLAFAIGKPVVDLSGVPVIDGEARLARALLGRRYRDPFTGAEIDVKAAIALMVPWRELVDRNRGLSTAAGMAFWKRREVARLLWDGRTGELPFLKPAAAIDRARREGKLVAAWPARVPADFAEQAATAGVAVRWVEDGFLRSAGLGSDLLPPLSLIVDDLWPYFDPERQSRLERLLATTDFDDDLIDRARRLRTAIVEGRIGKYHVGGPAGAPDLPTEGRLVLVVGQVEDDLSVQRGGGGMTNLTLIERARAAEPGAFIIYRPHPDVEAGHRKGAIPDAVALRLVDRVIPGGSLDALLARADALHTLTSLTGFEALMRGVRVVVHGSPFYAGWGLTYDRGPPLPRRRRRLTLDQLVAGALILYPRYLDPQHGLPCSPETFIGGLGGVSVNAGWLVRLRRWQGRLTRWLGSR